LVVLRILRGTVFRKNLFKNLRIPLLKNIRSLSILLFFILATKATAQFYSYPVEYFNGLITEKNLNAKDSSIHTGMKPYIPFFSKKYVNVPDTHRIFKYIKEDPALDLFFYDHLVDLKPKGEKFRLIIDPMINLMLGNDTYNGVRRQPRTNSRGVVAAGHVGDKVYFESLFCETQSFLPYYVALSAVSNSVVAGSGRWKTYKKLGFDYAYSSGFVSIQATKNINIQAGHGKHKIGNGYRSLFLSDNAFNYPYARITQQWLKGRLQYTNIYAVLTNFTPASTHPSKFVEPLLQKKPAAFQYLSINPTKFISFGLFQGMIWQAGNSRNSQKLTWEYFDPLIGVNAVTKGLKDSCNVLVGADLKIKLGDKVSIYGQIAADDPHTDSSGVKRGKGYQAGICFYDLLRIKNLFFQAEYNNVFEGMYGSPVAARTNQSFTHLNQNIAFSPGYGQEMLLVTGYKFRRLFLNSKFHYQTVPLNGDYFYTTRIATAELGFVINPSYNLNISMGFTHRNQKFPNFKDSNNETNFYFLVLRTGLYNLYYDY
jgi:hypothetical protein